MDFAVPHNPELAEFRKAVGAWLDNQVPPAVRVSEERARSSPEIATWALEFQRRLALQGWVAPSWPVQYGGGGLTQAHDAVVREELNARRIPRLFATNCHVAAAILAWGTEEQRQRRIRPLLHGQIAACRSVAELAVVADPDAASVRAEREGDVYLVSGEDAYWGSLGAPQYYWTLAVTNPEASPRRRLTAFLIPADLPGITVADRETIASGGQVSVTFDQAEVPVEWRVGEEGEGWLVAQSVLQSDVDVDRDLQEHQALVGMLIRYGTSLRARRSQEEYEAIEASMAEASIDTEVVRLLALRNQWLAETQQDITYHHAQYEMFLQNARERLAEIMSEVMGPLVLLEDSKWGLEHGEVAAFQRTSLPGIGPGESIADLQRIMHGGIMRATGFTTSTE